MHAHAIFIEGTNNTTASESVCAEQLSKEIEDASRRTFSEFFEPHRTIQDFDYVFLTPQFHHNTIGYFLRDSDEFDFQHVRDPRIWDWSSSGVRPRASKVSLVINTNADIKTNNSSKSHLLDMAIKLMGSKLVKRIKELDGYALEDPEQELSNAESILGLINFYTLHSVNTKPELYLTGKGNLKAEWRQSKHYKLVIEFLDAKRVMFVAFYRDAKAPNIVKRLSGLTLTNSFFDDVSRKAVSKLLGI